ncbi:MAG: response regulator transcription factor [Anaerolineae bacterium]|nr:response regulator transcription factor [Anaerolineae bacterium]
MRARPLLLVVEDEIRVSRYLRSSLQMLGYDVLVAEDGVKALELVQGNMPDLMLLDLRLPRMNGFEVLENVRRQFDMPIIVLTANAAEDDKVKALMMGADDYLTKPFGTRELQARIVAVMRRYRPAEPPATRDAVYMNGGLKIDYATRLVTVDGNSIHLTPTEYRLLLNLAENTNRVLTHDYLLSHVWGVEYSEDVHILRATIWRLRQKIEEDPTNPVYILNEPGIGYRLAQHETTKGEIAG